MNYVILKFGSLKGYDFTDDFIEKNKEVVEEFSEVWDKIYEKHCSAIGGSLEVRKDLDLKNEMLNVLYKLYELGVAFQNGFTDEYFNSFKEIENYIMQFSE